MPSLTDFFLNNGLFSRRTLREPKLPALAHYAVEQWVLPRSSWSDGIARLQSLLPREARVEKPARWYELLRVTHWPGAVPPGNGPFYVPDWVFEEIPDEEVREERREMLKKKGFRLMKVPTAHLSPTGEYLREAMRLAGRFAWTADPVLYQVHWYPELGRTKEPLRPFTTPRWQMP